MKKYISIALFALLTISLASCTKEADVAGIETKLPALQLSSLGYQQTGPFTIPTTVLQLNFGATSTGISTGAFKIEILNGTAATSPVIKTVNFPSWNGKDDSVITSNVPNGPHSISYTLQDTTYPTTSVYAGSILLKLSALGLTAGGTYSVRATALSADGTKTSVITQLSFFKTI
ncbi:hypothetical protein [Pedobacter miscanthi]|uniref:hypothetical protein n=1 Tax=Pedobacter miscanthi TaxID=2259170 RepID=UPI00292D4ED3|nr:hypothetical protein [Pedobacter miscanthi]